MSDAIFPSIKKVKDNKYNKLDSPKTGPLFHTIEYELSSICSKINILEEKDIKDIIIRQHKMILNYDLFLYDDKSRDQAQLLFTNRKFLKCLLDVIKLLKLDYNEMICINKLAYDYYILQDKDEEISNLLYSITTDINGYKVSYLSGILGLKDAQILAMLHSSSFKEDQLVTRVNRYIVRCSKSLSIQDIVNIYTFLFPRITNLFVYTMMENKPNNLTADQNKKFDYISIAVLELLNSLTSADIKRVLREYALVLKMVKQDTNVRFSIKSAIRFDRIIKLLRVIELEENIIIP